MTYTSKYFYLIIFNVIGFQVSFLCAQNTWTEIADFGGGQRERAVAFSIGGRGYVGTGQDTANLMHKDIWEYDPGSNSWTQKADLPGDKRRDAIAFSIGSKGYIGTGVTNAISFYGSLKKDFYEYNPLTNTWTAKASYPGNFGYGIYYASAFATSTKGYVVCGKKGASYYSNELWEYDPATNTWDEKDNFNGGERYGATAFAIGDKGYLGCGTDENAYTKDFWEYDPATDDWTEKAEFPGSNRFNATGFSLDGRGFIGLGTDGGFQNDLYEYNPIEDNWVEKADFGGSGRRAVATFVIDGYAYVGTGKGLTGKKRSFFKYAPYFFFAPEDPSDTKIISSVYPNPVIQNAYFHFEDEELNTSEIILNIFNAEGSIIHENNYSGKETFFFERNNLPAGIYYYQIKLTDKKNQKKYSEGKILLL